MHYAESQTAIQYLTTCNNDIQCFIAVIVMIPALPHRHTVNQIPGGLDGNINYFLCSYSRYLGLSLFDKIDNLLMYMASVPYARLAICLP